ncbi:MAG: DUF357 domain-containing protein [Candidatus Micrarchaeota archaeon]|nr:DUF357 domain-containing protein [Candidatus Micrarchaeota archaeon]MDE1823957.1 DUF357 domain-containing protein [Candidatus Micrarchaeota archaeon]MDE1849149.1 DUF357 domain-containing protein [Candidatus Micrarchaeota archaeon]
MEIEERIRKDIGIFSDNIKKVRTEKLNDKEKEVMELAKMYAQDAASWLEKKDYHTSFSSIAYAHGLLDAILKIEG